MDGLNMKAPPAIEARGAGNIFNHDFAEGTFRYEQYSNRRR